METDHRYPWGYKLLAVLLLDYSNVIGKYGFVVVRIGERNYFAFCIPKIDVLLQTWYTITDPEEERPNLASLLSFFEDTFFDPHMKNVDYQQLVSPLEQSKILFAMAIRFDMKEPASEFRKKMVVMPVSFVAHYIYNFPLINQVHYKLKRKKLVTISHALLGFRFGTDVVYPPEREPLINNNYRVNRATGEYEEMTTIFSSRKTHTFATQEFHNFPVSEEFLEVFGGADLHRVLTVCHDFFNAHYKQAGWCITPHLPVRVPVRVKMFTDTSLTAKCHKDTLAEYRSRRERNFAGTWDIHVQASVFFDDATKVRIRSWVEDNLVRVPVFRQANRGVR